MLWRNIGFNEMYMHHTQVQICLLSEDLLMMTIIPIIVILVTWDSFNEVIRYISHVFLCLDFVSKRITILILICNDSCNSMDSVNTNTSKHGIKNEKTYFLQK